MQGWDGSCRGGVGWVMQGWGGSCRGGVGHVGVGGSYRGRVGHAGVDGSCLLGHFHDHKKFFTLQPQNKGLGTSKGQIHVLPMTWGVEALGAPFQ